MKGGGSGETDFTHDRVAESNRVPLILYFIAALGGLTNSKGERNTSRWKWGGDQKNGTGKGKSSKSPKNEGSLKRG